MVRYFMLSAPHSHITYFKSRGFIQQSYQDKKFLQQLSPGDYIVLYAGIVSNSTKNPYKKIVGIARIIGRSIKTVTLGPKRYHRLAVRYLRFRETPLDNKISKLSFVTNKKNYEPYFRTGIREVSKKDFHVLCGYCY